jgi:uncharacterized membrane protein YidH (DUF202 family)
MARDPGLQPERTALAWSRTALAMLASALVLLRTGLVDEPSSLATCGGLLLVGAGWMQAVAVVRRRRLCEAGQALAGPMPATVPVPVPVIMGTALLTAACSGGALVAIVLTMN